MMTEEFSTYASLSSNLLSIHPSLHLTHLRKRRTQTAYHYNHTQDVNSKPRHSARTHLPLRQSSKNPS
jgi:hypothetical protein